MDKLWPGYKKEVNTMQEIFEWLDGLSPVADVALVIFMLSVIAVVFISELRR